MSGHKLVELDVDNLHLLGYSIAGEETVVGVPQLDVCFDIGKAPDQLIPINNVLLSHGHMDHAAGFAYYLSQRNFCGQKPGTIFVASQLVKPMEKIIDAWGKLDGNQVPVNLVPVKPGDEYQIKPNLIARVFPTKHSRGSLGFTIIEKRKKIKPEYARLNSTQIVELKKQGIEIDYPLEVPIISYLGDTEYADFSKIDYVANSKILVAECTFYLEEHIERAQAGKHMHINDFAPLLEKMNNKNIVITHTSQRISIGRAKKILRNNLNPEIYQKVRLFMDKCPDS